VYIIVANPQFRMLELHLACCAFAFALDNAGNNMAASMAMMAMTTSSSINVKARGEPLFPLEEKIRVFIGFSALHQGFQWLKSPPRQITRNGG